MIEDDDDLTPAATVVVLRDTSAGLEVLMLRRNNEGPFGGMWVFPGGRVDDDEIVPGDSLASARRAAVREAEEECGLVIAPDDMETWSHWVPPAAPQMTTGGRGPVRRFSTWFFVTHAPDGEVAIDGDEIHDHVWIAPSEAKARRDAGEIELVPPTWVTLHELEAHSTVAEAMAWARSREPELFRTRPIGKEPRTVAWFGDVAYGGGRADADGPRHRLIMHAEGWVYDRLDV